MPSPPSNSFSQTQYLPPFGIGQPGSNVVGGGGSVPEPFFRDAPDAARSMYRRTPAASWPDGYLGTIVSRRNDRLLDALKNRQNQRNYQRGVHKGERVDPADYRWPAEFTPDRGLRCEAAGIKQAPIGYVVEPTAEDIIPASGVRQPQVMNPARADALRRLAPTWRW
jgi:hypothetical protein